MVGDRVQDVVGARVVGMPTIGVTWGYAEPGELEAAGADQIVDSPQELVTALVDRHACLCDPGKYLSKDEGATGRCRTPWTMITSPLDDYGEPERSELRVLLDEE